MYIKEGKKAYIQKNNTYNQRGILMTDYEVITNIKDHEILQKIGWKFKTNILIVTMEPLEDIKILPKLKGVQIKEHYHDSFKIIDDAFKENKLKVAVVAPDLIGTHI